MRSNAPEYTRRRRARTRTALGGATVSLLAAGMAFGGASAAQAADPVTIDVVTINDFHGRLEASQLSAGAAVLAGAVDSVRATNPNTVMVSAGDNIGASTFTSFIQADNPTIDALNAMRLDASAAGNHEFDQGYEDLLTRVVPRAEYDILAANVDGPAQFGELPEYSVEEVGGIRIGFIGAVTEELLSLVSPAGMAGVSVDPIVDSVNRVADQLSDGDDLNGEADIVIAVTHEGASTSSTTPALDIAADSVFGRIVTGLDADVDAIVSGHTHQRYAGTASIDPLGRPLIQAGQYSEAMGRLTLTVDPDTKALTAATPAIVPLVTRSGAGTTASPYVYTPNFAADPAVATIVSDASAVAAVEGARPLGEIAADFNRAAQAGAVDGSTENRGGESTLSNFVADVQLWSTRELGTEVAFMNPGGLRTDLVFADRTPTIPGDGAGLVTYREAAEVQPFANTLVTTTLTGDQIKQVLEQQWQPSTASRPFLKLGVSKELTYTYDPDAPAGSHITGIRLNGAPLAADTAVRVVANSFLASGGDNFTAFRSGTASADSGRVDLAGMVDYFDARDSAVSPDLGQRAIGVKLAASAQEGGYLPGDRIDVALSSLAFSTTEAKPTTAEIRLDGVLVGSAAVDATIVNTTDEVGRATVPVTLPADITAGAHELVITTPGNSTEARIAITVAQAPVAFPEIQPLPEEALNADNDGDGVVSGPGVEVEAGGYVTIEIDGHEGEQVEVFIYSAPRSLGVHTVTNGRVTVQLPTGLAAGPHRLAVYGADGALIGWTSITVAAAAVAPVNTGANADRIASTGFDAATTVLPAILAGLALLAGAVALIARKLTLRRRATRS